MAAKDYQGKLTGAQVDALQSRMNNLEETVNGMLDTLTISVSGQTEIKAAGTYAYTISYGLSSDNTIDIKSITAESDNTDVVVSGLTNNGFSLIVDKLPLATSVTNIKITVKEKHSGVSIQNLTLNLVVVPLTDIDVTGSDTLTSQGTDAEYSIVYTPSDANNIKDIVVTIGN